MSRICGRPRALDRACMKTSNEGNCFESVECDLSVRRLARATRKRLGVLILNRVFNFLDSTSFH